MFENYYKVLGVPENASKKEIEEAYAALKAKYSEDRFKEGEEGNQASRNLMELEDAYLVLLETFTQPKVVIGDKADYSAGADYSAIDKLIKQNRIAEAQSALDNMSQRQGEWHYLQSIIFYKRGWYGECRTQLRVALTMEPFNPKYRAAAEKLELFLGNIRTENNMGPGTNPGVYSEGYDQRKNSACNNPLCCLPSLCCCAPYLCNPCGN